MKKILINLFAIIIITVLVLFSCKEEEDYDWKKIEPGTQLISGPDSVKGNDSTVYEYLALTRGGSKYTWSVLYGPVKIKVDDTNKDPLHYHPYRVELMANSTVNDSAAIMVQETTWAGKTGITDTFFIKKVNCYLPFDISTFIGEYSGTEKRENADETNPVDYTLDSVMIKYLDGNTFVNENFLGGFKLKFKLSLNKEESVTIIDTVYNNATYDDAYDGFKVKGTGSYSICNRELYLNYVVIDKTVQDTIYKFKSRFKHK